MKKVLTIAGSDPSGGAGIQADIKTITVHGLYACSVITSLTAQNTMGVYRIVDVEPDFVAAQMDSVFSDIFPDAVKIGMVSGEGILEAILYKLRQYRPANIIIDPVMVSTSGRKLLSSRACKLMEEELLPLGTLITPNIPEAEVLTGLSVHTEADMAEAAQRLALRTGNAVLIKGGHREGEAADILFCRKTVSRFVSRRIENPNTHGTGCTLSSSIACHMAEGYNLEESIQKAKDYLNGALEAMLDLGNGNGPLNHMYAIRGSGIGDE